MKGESGQRPTTSVARHEGPDDASGPAGGAQSVIESLAGDDRPSRRLAVPPFSRTISDISTTSTVSHTCG